MAISRGYVNNFSTTLNGSITNSATSIVVTDATGISTALGLSDFVMLTIDDATNVEIVKVTAVASNTLTVVRGQEGTSGTAFASGVDIECRATANSFKDSFDVVTVTTLAGGETEFKFEGLTAGVYEIDMKGISADDASAPELKFTVGTGGTPTYSGANYRYALMNGLDNGGTVSNFVPGTTAYCPLWDAMYFDNAFFATNGTILTSDLGSTTQYKTFDVNIRQTKTGFGGLAQMRKGVIAWNDSTAITAIKVALSSGTFRAGGVITLRKRKY